MPAAKYNFTIEQGTDFSRQLTFKDSVGVAISLVNDTFTGDIKTSYSSAEVLASFTFDTTQAASGIVIYSLTDSDTDVLPSTIDTDRLVYDIKRTKDGGAESRVLQGKIKVTPAVTKEAPVVGP